MKQRVKTENKESTQKTTKSHIIFCGNKRVIVASREAIGAMKYKSE